MDQATRVRIVVVSLCTVLVWACRSQGIAPEARPSRATAPATSTASANPGPDATTMPAAAVASTPDIERAFGRLYDCVWKAQQTDAFGLLGYTPDYDLVVLEPELFYVLDARTPELYLFTPYFAGGANLQEIMKLRLKAELDAHPLEPEHFPVTLCCGNLDYDVRVPYLPDDPSKPRGYYYLQFSDGTPMVRDELYYGGDHRMHVRRLDESSVSSRPHEVRRFGLARFLPGEPQAKPDFKRHAPPRRPNSVTVLSVTGQKDDGVEYQPSSEERKLWDRTAKGNFSEAAERVLVSVLHRTLSSLPPIHQVGQKSDCWGHLGCDYVYDGETVAGEHEAREAAIRSCKAADEFQLGLF
jgi:hypothetical protein